MTNPAMYMVFALPSTIAILTRAGSTANRLRAVLGMTTVVAGVQVAVGRARIIELVAILPILRKYHDASRIRIAGRGPARFFRRGAFPHGKALARPAGCARRGTGIGDHPALSVAGNAGARP